MFCGGSKVTIRSLKWSFPRIRKSLLTKRLASCYKLCEEQEWVKASEVLGISLPWYQEHVLIMRIGEVELPLPIDGVCIEVGQHGSVLPERRVPFHYDLSDSPFLDESLGAGEHL